jgi:hypothetical protein
MSHVTSHGIPHLEGALARKLDFDDITVTLGAPPAQKTELRLTGRSDRLRGPDKYKVLDHRRRQAQIAARRLLDLL